MELERPCGFCAEHEAEWGYPFHFPDEEPVVYWRTCARCLELVEADDRVELHRLDLLHMWLQTGLCVKATGSS
jgi:hypothetical protein